MKRAPVLLLILLLLALALPALADDVCTLDTAGDAQVSTDRSYIRVTCPEVAGDVSVSARDGAGNLVYQKDYGQCSGAFRSDDLYLALNGSKTVYIVTLDVDGAEHRFTVTRTMPRLQGNSACSAGLPLSEITGRDAWQSATVIDLHAAEGSTLTMPLQASGAYTLGEVLFSVSGGTLTVHAALDKAIDGTIDSASVYAAVNALEASQLGARSYGGASGALDKAIDLHGADYAVVYVALTVSFDPADAPAIDRSARPGQQELWQIIDSTTINEAVG